MRSLVLFSGGLDSSVALAKARVESDEVAALSFQYGSVHNAREARAAEYIAKYFLIKRYEEVIHLPAGQSTLMGVGETPARAYEQEGPQPTVVPFRNAVLLSYAVAFAEAEGFDHVWSGQHADDHGHWAYPDCSPEFLGAMAAAVYVGTYHKVRLVFPFVWMTKAEVVAAGALLNVPFSYTYSCYRGGDIHCGACPTCIERKRAFFHAGVVDNTVYGG